MKKKSFAKLIMVWLLAVTMLIGAAAEDNPPAGEAVPEEEGILEIQPLMEGTSVEDTEGMDLEQLTEAVTNEAMSEYWNSDTGFRMQYPATFIFSEEGGIAQAVDPEGMIRMTIECMPRDAALTEEMIQQAIMLDSPDARIRRYEESDCLRFDRDQDDGSLIIDLYVFAPTKIHHISIACAEAASETTSTWLEYMIHSIQTDETDVG